MKHFLTKLPLPVGGVMLALLSLAKLYSTLDMPVVSTLFFGGGLVVFLLILAKVLFTFSSVREGLQNPVVASVSPTISMGTMVLASILGKSEFFAGIATILWFVALLIQILLIAYFTSHFIWRQPLALTDLYPSWFIIFVGLGIVPTTAGAHMPQLTHAVFWLVLTTYVLLLPIVLVRLLKYEMDEPVKPLLTLLAAPGSLCLASYLNAFTHHSAWLVVALLIVSQAMYVIVLLHLPKLLNLPFYPSYAAFTFPLVISATAMFTVSTRMDFLMLHWVAFAEIMIATVVVCYVFIRYVVYFSKIRTA